MASGSGVWEQRGRFVAISCSPEQVIISSYRGLQAAQPLSTSRVHTEQVPVHQISGLVASMTCDVFSCEHSMLPDCHVQAATGSKSQQPRPPGEIGHKGGTRASGIRYDRHHTRCKTQGVVVCERLSVVFWPVFWPVQHRHPRARLTAFLAHLCRWRGGQKGHDWQSIGLITTSMPRYVPS